MNILALDSSGKTASVCLLADDNVLYEERLDEGLTHSETLLPLVMGALDKTGLAMPDIGLLAATAGPGSFTGLRIGLSLLKGLTLPHHTPAAGVSTLRAIAMASGQAGLIVPALDARRGEVYWAAFLCRDGKCQRLVPDTASPATEVGAWLQERYPDEENIHLVGDGAELCYNSFAFAQAVVLPQRLPLHPAARGAALAAAQKWRHGLVSDAAALRPVYLRLSQAERERAAALSIQPNTPDKKGE